MAGRGDYFQPAHRFGYRIAICYFAVYTNTQWHNARQSHKALKARQFLE
jgi:hypothetical protein